MFRRFSITVSLAGASLLGGCATPVVQEVPQKEPLVTSAPSVLEEEVSVQPTVLEDRPSQFATYQGVIRAVTTADMQPGYEIDREDGLPVELTSQTVNLEELVGEDVRVSGMATVSDDGQHVTLDVTSIWREQDEESSASEPASVPAVASSSSIASSRTSSAASVKPVTTSSASSRKSQQAVSSAAATSSAPAQQTDEKTKVMAKDKTDTALFSQQYCSTHIGFCVSLHKNWYYQSFGGNVPPSLWHVEIGPQPVEDVGDGVILLTLQQGDIPDGGSDGTVVDKGDYVVVYKQWTNGRYFSISAPTSLRSAAQGIAATLTVLQSE